jgi:hypothetical protein
MEIKNQVYGKLLEEAVQERKAIVSRNNSSEFSGILCMRVDSEIWGAEFYKVLPRSIPVLREELKPVVNAYKLKWDSILNEEMPYVLNSIGAILSRTGHPDDWHALFPEKLHKSLKRNPSLITSEKFSRLDYKDFEQLKANTEKGMTLLRQRLTKNFLGIL